MSTYFSGIAVLMIVLSPLFVPVAITVAPLVSSGVRRVGRTFGLLPPRLPDPPDHDQRKAEPCPPNSPPCSARR